MSTLFKGLVGSGNVSDKLINELLVLFWELEAHPSDNTHNAFVEHIARNLKTIDRKFLLRIKQRAENNEEDSGLARMLQLLMNDMCYIILGELTMCPPFGLAPLSELVEDPELTDEKVKAYLRKASKKYYYPLFEAIYSFCKDMHQGAIALDGPDHEIKNLKRIANLRRS